VYGSNDNADFVIIVLEIDMYSVVMWILKYASVSTCVFGTP
jgi:hypothetical protein